jgi:hypothetical protein
MISVRIAKYSIGFAESAGCARENGRASVMLRSKASLFRQQVLSMVEHCEGGGSAALTGDAKEFSAKPHFFSLSFADSQQRNDAEK